MGLINHAAERELLVVARGHPYERDALAAVFDALAGYRWSLVEQPAASLLIASGACVGRFDAIVFYDMPGVDFSGPEPGRAVPPSAEVVRALQALMDAGQGLVFLHHALAAWPAWEEYAEIVGGRFHYRPAQLRGQDWPDSGYRHHVEHTIEVVAEHPVTAGLPPHFTLRDELYLCPVFEDSVTPLLRSHHAFVDANFHSAWRAITGNPGSREGWTHPEGSALVGWAKHHRASPIVYLQGGDDATALADPHYRQLVHNAVRWVASPAARDWVRERTSRQPEERA